MNCGMNPPFRRKANFKWADSVTGKPKAELLQALEMDRFYGSEAELSG